MPNIEEEKVRILGNIGGMGGKYEDSLAAEYRLNVNDPRNATVRAAVSDMVLESIGSASRQMMINVIGREGEIKDVEYLALLLDATKKPWLSYPSRRETTYAKRAHVADSDEKVRNAAVEAIEGMLSRNTAAGAPLKGDAGKALVNCALLDESEMVRKGAAEKIWNYGDMETISLLLKEFTEADAEKEQLIYARAYAAVQQSAEAMGKRGIMRKTALACLGETSEGKKGAAVVAGKIIIELAKKYEDALAWLIIAYERAKADQGAPRELQQKRERHYNALLDQTGMVRRNTSEIPAPQPELAKGPDVKPTRDEMRPVRMMRKAAENDEPVELPLTRSGKVAAAIGRIFSKGK